MTAALRPLAPVRLDLLDVFALHHGTLPMAVPLPAQRLLAFLALHRSAVHRRVLAGVLWADLGEQAAAARLRSTLWRLPAVGGTKLVAAGGGRVELSDHVEVDLQVVEDDARLDDLEITRLSCDLLADWDEPWVQIERERFRQVRLRRLEQLSDRARARGDLGAALQAALSAVAVEPLRESGHRRVILAHLADANPAEALRQYDLVRCLLRDQLGIAPAAATRELVAGLLGRPLDVVG